MMDATPMRWLLAMMTASALLAQTGLCQKPVCWRAYRVMDGLPDSDCLSVTIGAHGKILVRHPSTNAVSELDGYSIQTIPLPEFLHGRVNASPGGQLWMAGPSGLHVCQDGDWKAVPAPDAGMNPFGDSISLLPLRKDRVLLLKPDQLLECSLDTFQNLRIQTLKQADQTGIGRFCGMIQARNGSLWLAGEQGLIKTAGQARELNPESTWTEHLPPAPAELGILGGIEEGGDDSITLLAGKTPSDQAAVLHFDGEHWTTLPCGREKIRRAWRGPGNLFWAASTDTLFQREESDGVFKQYEELPACRFHDVAVEPDGAFWLATSDGLYRCAPNLWHAPTAARPVTTLIHCMAEDDAGRLWFLTGNGLHMLRNEEHRVYPPPVPADGTSRMGQAIYVMTDGTLLLAHGDNWMRFSPRDGMFRPLPPGANGRRYRVIGQSQDGQVYAASHDPGSTNTNHLLELFSGRKFSPFPEQPPANVLDAGLDLLFAARNGDLWVSGPHGCARYHERKWQVFPTGSGAIPRTIAGFSEMPDGTIWCATEDSLWEFDGHNWLSRRSGFDRIHSLLGTRDGSLWVASDNGLFRLFKGAWIENSMEDGLPSFSIRSLLEDKRGMVWAGTTHGLSRHHPEVDPDPPRTTATLPEDWKYGVPDSSTVTISLTGQDKWKYTTPGRLLFFFRLDERDWTFCSGSSVSFDSLPEGRHFFQARAMDRNGNIDPNPFRLEFTVPLPWYKETRLLLVSTAGLSLAVFFAYLAFNRHRKLVRSHGEVERKVAERTNELDLAHRELLHSQKMNALGTIAAGIAHDFNNILSIVKGSAQIIEDNLDNPGKIRTRVNRIKTVVDQGSGIVQAMLGFCRGSGAQPESCNLNVVVDGTIELLGDRFTRETEILFEPGDDVLPVCIMRDHVQQILLNFLFNAAESMSGRKRIQITTRWTDKPPAGLVLAPGPAPAYATVSVRDSGCGIQPENLHRIFEPFFTTKSLSSKRGTGLGLSMAYELARNLQAGLAVESEAGRGSIFTLILPASPAANEAHAPEPPSPNSDPQQTTSN